MASVVGSSYAIPTELKCYGKARSTTEGGLNSNTGGAEGPRDTIGQVQLELIRWENRPRESGEPFLGLVETEQVAEEYDGDVVLAEIERRLADLPGIQTEILNLSRGPASARK